MRQPALAVGADKYITGIGEKRRLSLRFGSKAQPDQFVCRKLKA
jgi:hypothetical protein